MIKLRIGSKREMIPFAIVMAIAVLAITKYVIQRGANGDASGYDHGIREQLLRIRGNESQSLELSYVDDVEGYLKEAADLRGLAFLSIGKTTTSDLQMEPLANLGQVEHLYLVSCPGISDKTLETVARMPHLKSLVIDDCPITDIGLNKLATAPELIELEILQCKFLTSNTLRTLAGLKHLRILKLRGGWASTNEINELRKSLSATTVITLE